MHLFDYNFKLLTKITFKTCNFIFKNYSLKAAVLIVLFPFSSFLFKMSKN